MGTLAGGRNSFATVVNDHDVVVGLAENQAGEGVAVKWTSAGRIAPLGSFGGRLGLATDINERGQVVGAAADTTPAPGGRGHYELAVEVNPAERVAAVFIELARAT